MRSEAGSQAGSQAPRRSSPSPVLRTKPPTSWYEPHPSDKVPRNDSRGAKPSGIADEGVVVSESPGRKVAGSITEFVVSESAGRKGLEESNHREAPEANPDQGPSSPVPQLDIQGALAATEKLAERLGGVEFCLESSRNELGLNVDVLSAENTVIRNTLAEMDAKLDLLLAALARTGTPTGWLEAKMDMLVAEVQKSCRLPSATTPLLGGQHGGGGQSLEPLSQTAAGTPRRQPPRGDIDGEVEATPAAHFTTEPLTANGEGRREAAAPVTAPAEPAAAPAAPHEGYMAQAAPAAQDSHIQKMDSQAGEERSKYRELYRRQDEGVAWMQSIEEKIAAHKSRDAEEAGNLFQRIARSVYFQIWSVVVIVGAVILMAVQTEMQVQEQIGISLCMEGKGPAPELQSLTFYEVVEWLLLVWMSIEVVINVKAAGALFSGEGANWNLFDIVIIIGTLFQKIFSGTNLSSLRVLRIARTLKFVRVFKALRAFKATSALLSGVRKLLLCLVGSLPSLFWALFIIAMFLLLMAIMLMQGIEVYYDFKLDDAPLGECRPGGLGNNLWDGRPTYNEIFPPFVVDPENDTHTEQVKKLYGTLDRTMMTLFSTISGGAEWQVVADPLARISTAFFVMWVLYICISMYGVLNVFTGVFCESAVAAAAADTQSILDQELEDIQDCERLLRQAFARIDVDGSGSLTEPELHKVLTDPITVGVLARIGLEASESKGLFKMLDVDGSGILSVDEFVDGCVSLKGGARRVDIIALMNQSRRLSKTVTALMEMCDAMWTNLEQGINKFPESSRQAGGNGTIAIPDGKAI